jgi:CRP-like cAMP-binding protein
LTSALLQRSVLQAVQFGLAVSPESAADVAAELEAVTCRGGDWLFRQGDPADGLYLLVRGRLQVWIDTP